MYFVLISLSTVHDSTFLHTHLKPAVLGRLLMCCHNSIFGRISCFLIRERAMGKTGDSLKQRHHSRKWFYLRLVSCSVGWEEELGCRSVLSEMKAKRLLLWAKQTQSGEN